MDKGKKESRVESMMAADASSVSLLSCEDKTKIAVEAGSAKNIIPVLNGTPVTLNAFNSRYPVKGKRINLKNEARIETFMCLARPAKERDPPMEINARGSVTEVIRLNVLSTNTGKPMLAFEKKIPATHPIIKGLEIRALIKKSIFSLKRNSLPENHIRVETARILIIGIIKPASIPKCLTPGSFRILRIIAIPR